MLETVPIVYFGSSLEIPIPAQVILSFSLCYLGNLKNNQTLKSMSSKVTSQDAKSEDHGSKLHLCCLLVVTQGASLTSLK